MEHPVTAVGQLAPEAAQSGALSRDLGCKVGREEGMGTGHTQAFSFCNDTLQLPGTSLAWGEALHVSAQLEQKKPWGSSELVSLRPDRLECPPSPSLSSLGLIYSLPLLPGPLLSWEW